MRKIYFCLALLFLISCDHIERENRLIYEKPATAKRVVLLEDFTGQRCVNCPKGTEIIDQLIAEYGDTSVVAVGIHAGPLGFYGNDNTIGLATEVGDEYFQHWNLEYQPVGLINRHSPINYPEWSAAVKEELGKPATLSLEASAFVDNENNIYIFIEALGTDGPTDGMLQVWIVEDGITAMQMMPDGSTNPNYVHNHVFRKAVNGVWGDKITLQEGEMKSLEYALDADAIWNVSHLSVVAFVYNDTGVLQAIKIKIQ